ncbi:MAG: 16S rRNA (guanine(966)-N(2))-methyltransferase RsmD [Ignavibacteriae bacterium]|nr:16S rRNA (guanine(966)-N(2))-methyltransferase RsmD [Ignavibacteriota bacterium]
MRIVSGEFKGRTLVSVPDNSVRPATDRVKTTIFNMLQNRLRIYGANVLDLFAGSGNLGFEALSRGAANTVFVESSNNVVRTIQKNIELLKCDERADIVQLDAMYYLNSCRERFDLIFADPPYVYEQTIELPALIFQKNLLNNNGLLIIEHSKHTVFETSKIFQLSVQKEFGQTRVSFFQKMTIAD